MNVITVRNLIKKYQDVIAVSDVSFTVEEGIIFGMLGPNGAGKSTTIECLIGLKKRDGGSVELLGYDPLTQSKLLFHQIGVQLQETAYQDKIKVFELCDLFKSMYESPTDYESLLVQFDLGAKKKAYISKLSGGQKQKIAIILALIANPKVIFLDELTTGLDPHSRREMWQHVLRLKAEGRTVFMTTHYMEEASYLCDQICIIDEGKIVALDSVDGVIKQAEIDLEISFVPNPTTDSFENQVSRIQAGLQKKTTHLKAITTNGQKISIRCGDENMINDLILLLSAEKIAFTKLNILRPGLEDAYLKLTGKRWEDSRNE